jgi:hypothetical protein
LQISFHANICRGASANTAMMLSRSACAQAALPKRCRTSCSLPLAEIGATDESWPNGDEILMAASVGERFAGHVAASVPGMAEPGVWRQLADMRVFRQETARRAGRNA